MRQRCIVGMAWMTIRSAYLYAIRGPLKALGVCAGLWWLDPAVQWYLGASGVLHGVMAAGCVRRIAERQWDRWLLSIALVTKLLWEQHGAHFDAAMPVIVDAHWLGALGGAAIAAALCARMAIIRR